MAKSIDSMRLGAALVVAGSSLVLMSACNRGRGAEDPVSVQNQQQIAPPNGQPGYAAQPGQPGIPASYNNAPAVGQQPGGAPNPSPLALPCQNDFICGTHKCNMQTGRCSFPCASNADCTAGFSCMGGGGPAAICIPGGTSAAQ